MDLCKAAYVATVDKPVPGSSIIDGEVNRWLLLYDGIRYESEVTKLFALVREDPAYEVYLKRANFKDTFLQDYCLWNLKAVLKCNTIFRTAINKSIHFLRENVMVRTNFLSDAYFEANGVLHEQVAPDKSYLFVWLEEVLHKCLMSPTLSCILDKKSLSFTLPVAC